MLVGAVAVGIGALAAFRRPNDTVANGMMSDGMLDGGMMGGGMKGVMSPGDMQGPMRTGMEMFRHHAEMKRTASDIPGGIHAITVSEDPRVASLIQEHVSAMYARLDGDQPFPYPMSRSVPAMFTNSTRYHRTLTMLPKGIAVTETSDDPAMVAVIRSHAQEIGGFVNDGMPAMMRGMM